MRKLIPPILMLACLLPARSGKAQSCLSAVTLNIVATPVPDITGNFIYCQGTSTTLSVQPGFSFYAWSSGESGANTSSISATSTGSYFVTVTNSTGCTGTDQVVLAFSGSASTNIVANPYQCNGQLTLDAGGGFTSYAWSTGDNSQTTTVSSSGNYTVTVTSSFGCTGTDDITVSIPTALVVAISGNLSFCSGGNTILSATPGFVGYAWTGGNNGQNLNVTTGGNYSVTATDAAGCTATASVVVQENAFTPPTISGNSLLCPGGTIILSADGPNYQGYAWSSGQGTQTIPVTTPGPYTVTVTATNSCTGTASVSVQGGNPVNTSITGNPVICTGGTTTLSATGSFVDYDWSNGMSGPNITVNQVGLYTVTVTSAQGCTGTASITTTQGTPPVVNIAPIAQNLCEDGNPVQLQANPAGGLWSGDVSTSGVISPAVLGAGAWEANYTFVDPNGCVGSDQLPFVILPNTVVLIQPVGPLCLTDPIQTLSGTPVGGTWGGVANASGQIDPAALGPGIHQVSYTAAQPGSCPNEALASVEINAQPTAGISGTGTVCSGGGQSVPLSLNIFGSGNVEVTYTINGLSPVTVSFPAGTATLNATEAGIYQITNVVDAFGCPGIGSGVGEVLLAPNLAVSNFDVQCDPNDGTYTVSFQVTNGDPSSYTVNAVALGSPYQYTSSPIPSGDNYQFLVDDANGCNPILLAGSFDCNCATSSGNMNLTPLVFCEGSNATATFNNNEQLDADDALVFVLHSGSSNSLGTVYGTNTTPSFPFAPPLVTGQTYYISAVAGNSNGSGGVDLTDPCLSISFGTPVSWTPVPDGNLLGNATICAGATATLTFSLTGNGPFDLTYSNGSQQFTLPNVGNTASVNVNPTTTTVYTLQQVALNAIPTCSAAPNSSVTITVNTIPPTNLSAQICQGESIFLGGASQTQAGTYTDTLSTAAGCDSILVTVLTVNAIDTTFTNGTSCNQAQTGVFTTVFAAQNGCDSVVINTVTYSAVDSTFLTSTTCDPSQAGVFTQSFTNQLGCDSLVSTTVTLLPSNTTTIFDTSCDPSQTGVFTTVFAAQNGCDSVVISTITYSAVDSTFLTSTTCDASQAGVFTQSFTNQLGCDSLVTTTVTLLPSDTINIFDTTCDPSQTGVFTTVFASQNGCDSVVISTITYSAVDSTFLTSTTCDASQAGVFTQSLTNQLGCDSLVTTTVTLLPSDTTSLSSTTCDPSQVGVFVQNLSTWQGCDSTVTTTVILLPSATTFLTSTTCDPTQAGVFIQNLTTWQGCDSTVTTTVTLLPSATTSFASTTCDPTQAGVFVENLSTWQGCDSTVTTTVTLLPNATTNITTTTCDPTQVGISTQNLTTWQGCDSTVVSTVTLTPPPTLVVTASDFGGFGTSCAGASDGWAKASATGTSPFLYVWENGTTSPMLEGLSANPTGASTYAVTVTDGNGCTSEGAVEITGPEPLTIALSITALGCFDDGSGAILANAAGGVPAYMYSLNPVGTSGGPFMESGTFGGLGAGAYEVTTQDANGCSTTDLVAINAPVPLSVELGDDVFLELGDGTALSALVNVPLDSLAEINWSGIANPECPGCPQQQVFPVVTTNYTVAVVDSQGCIASDGVTVYVDQTKSVYVPNAFSPNGDGLNDLLTIFSKEGQVRKVKSFLVFDRWGESVYQYFDFEPNDPATGWDGTHRGQLLDAAVFVWFAEVEFVDGSTALFEGDVTLMQ